MILVEPNSNGTPKVTVVLNDPTHCEERPEDTQEGRPPVKKGVRRGVQDVDAITVSLWQEAK